MAEKEQGKLSQAKEVLAAQGIKPIQYKHLDYYGILKMAGIKP